MFTTRTNNQLLSPDPNSELCTGGAACFPGKDKSSGELEELSITWLRAGPQPSHRLQSRDEELTAALLTKADTLTRQEYSPSRIQLSTTPTLQVPTLLAEKNFKSWKLKKKERDTRKSQISAGIHVTLLMVFTGTACGCRWRLPAPEHKPGHSSRAPKEPQEGGRCSAPVLPHLWQWPLSTVYSLINLLSQSSLFISLHTALCYSPRCWHRARCEMPFTPR